VALIAWLKSNETPKPRTVASVPKKPDPAQGRVQSNILHGELFLHLKGKPEDRTRLRWDPKLGGERELPAGTYTLTGYRHVATAKDGVQWIWSTTSPGYRELVVKPGETVPFRVQERLHVRARAFEKNGKHRVGIAFQAEKRLGHTLYRDGLRIAITWQCLDAKKKVLSKGAMRYG
jgi:hypothetical protein